MPNWMLTCSPDLDAAPQCGDVDFRMAWKIERYLGEVCAGGEHPDESYDHLGPREFAIVACAYIDVALAELLALRLRDDAKEAEEFLGANEDGRAPAGSLGARIQLAYLLGLLNENHVRGFRALKALRNYMAHRVNTSLLAPKAQACLEPIRIHWQELVARPESKFEDLQPIIRGSRKSEAEALRMVKFHFWMAQIALRGVREHVIRVDTLVE
jgi:hypothetical protein